MPGSDRVKPASPGVKLTYDDFVLFPDDGKRHELIDGEHYVTPSPNTRHQQILGGCCSRPTTSCSRSSTWWSPTFCTSRMHVPLR